MTSIKIYLATSFKKAEHSRSFRRSSFAYQIGNLDIKFSHPMVFGVYWFQDHPQIQKSLNDKVSSYKMML